MMRSKLLARLYTFSLVILPFTFGQISGCSPFFTGRPHNQLHQKISHIKHIYSQQNKERWFDFFKKLLSRQQNTLPSKKIPSDNFWICLRQDFCLTHDIDRAAVKEQIHWFTSRPYQLRHTIQRSAPYIHYVYEQIKKRHLPGELVLLPLIESTYNPLATNTISGASGLWQLTTRTAKGFGIRQDWLFDGRHDIYASTHAALDYLTYLNQFFSNDWLLTLAAYDTGEGNVQQAIRYNTRRNLDTNVWKLPLALETRSYVPRLLALSAIIANPRKYNVTLPNISNHSYFKQVNVEAGISIVQASELANISIKQLKQLNPGFKQLIFIPKKPYRLLLPAHCVENFEKKLKALPPEAFYLRLFHHTTQPGETLIGIAKRYHIEIEHLCLWNGLSLNHILPVKKKLIIKAPYSTSHVLSSQKMFIRNHGKQYYTVRLGDNLSVIAQHLNVPLNDLKKWNPLKNAVIQPGQRLTIYPK